MHHSNRHTLHHRSRLVAIAVLAALAGACTGADEGPQEAATSTSAAAPTPSGAPAPPIPPLATPGWHRLPDPPLSPRNGATAAWTGREVLVVGGDEFLCPPSADCAGPTGPPFADGAAFDPRTGAWRPIAPAPVGLRHATTAVLDGDVYLAGPADLLRYRTADDEWEVLDWMPGPWRRGESGIVVVGDELVFPNTSAAPGERAGWRYEPAAGTWSEVPTDPLPEGVDRHTTVVDDELLAFGVDRWGREPTIVGAALDPTTGTWTRLPDRPGSAYQAWAIDGLVVLNPHFGREAGGGLFDPAAGTWSALPTAPAVVGGDLAGVLGRDTAVFSRPQGWVLDLTALGWVEVPDLEAFETSWPATRAAAGRDLFVYGGERWSGPFASEGRLLGEARWWTAPEGAPG